MDNNKYKLRFQTPNSDALVEYLKNNRMNNNLIVMLMSSFFPILQMYLANLIFERISGDDIHEIDSTVIDLAKTGEIETIDGKPDGEAELVLYIGLLKQKGIDIYEKLDEVWYEILSMFKDLEEDTNEINKLVASTDDQSEQERLVKEFVDGKVAQNLSFLKEHENE